MEEVGVKTENKSIETLKMTARGYAEVQAQTRSGDENAYVEAWKGFEDHIKGLKVPQEDVMQLRREFRMAWDSRRAELGIKDEVGQKTGMQPNQTAKPEKSNSIMAKLAKLKLHR